MSQHSLLNIQQISSRTFNNDPSIMETSIEHFQRQNHPNFTKHDLHNMSLKKTIHHGLEDVVRDMSAQNQGLKREVDVWKNRYIEMQRGNGGNLNHAQILRQLSQKLAMKDAQLQEKGRAYNTAIINLKETIAKNQLLSDQVQRLTRKVKQSQLNYSREQQVYQKSQNLISNLSITKSNYEIELVNMKDSLIILEKENKKIADTNQEYEEKLALISQEIERLNRKDQNARKEKSQLEAKIKKYELQTTDQKSSLEKMRMENRDYNSKIQALSMQLREFHEQITYKETIINDYKIGQAKIERLLKEKEGYIEELQSRIVQMQRYFKNKQEQFNKQRSSYSQEIGKLRSKISDQTTSSKQVAVRSESIQNEYQKLYQQHGYLKNQLNKEAHEKQALFEEFKSVSSQRDNLIRDKQELIRQLDTISNQNRQLNNQIQNLKSDLLMWQEKYQKTEQDFRRYEENERALINDYQAKITQVNQQRLSELNAKVSELNQCKFELANKINEINQIKTEISIKSTELIRLKEDTTAQSNIFEFSRKQYDDKLRERMEMINDLKNRLGNCEKMIDQNRRERDMLLQQNQSLINVKQKSQRAIQMKNQDINTTTVKIEELGRSLKEISSLQDKKSQQLQNCKRIIRSNQDTIKELNFKLVNGDNNMKNLSMELQRVVNILKEKQTIIIELTNKCRQYVSTLEKSNLQVSNLKQNNQKMHMSLSYAQQSNSNFQIFMKQIERLNQIVLGKDGEIKNLRGQLGRLIQKIDLISQEQLKIVKVLQASYQSASQKDIETNNQFTDLKDFISRLNQNTNISLKDLYTQSSSIINQLNQTENDTRQNSTKLQQKLMEAQRNVERKETEIILLKKEVKDLQIKVQQYNMSSVNQSEIFEKILQLSRQNAAVREQIMKISSQRDNDIQNKNKNITYLESQLKQLQVTQGKELSQLKLYLQEKERIFEQRSIRLNYQNAALKQQINQRDRIIGQYENRINHISLQIDNRMKQMKGLQKELLQNSSELQAYKRIHQQNQQSPELISQIQIYQNQISKFMKIIEIRQEQLAKNQESFEKLQKQNKKYKQRNMQLQLKCQQHAEQKYHLQQKLRQSQSINYHFQQVQAKTNNSSQSTRQVQALKEQNEALDRRLKQFHTKLRQNEGKLSMTQEQVSNLMHNLSKVGEIHNEIHEIQTLHKKTNELQERNYHLENQLEDGLQKINQLSIQNNYLLQEKEQNKIFHHAYESKSAQIERQNKKLKEVLDNTSRKYARLQMKNHEFEIQLKKAQILQQNIQVLKGQLNRLSQINIDLNEEASSCKLALSDESTIQRRNTQLLTLIVILMAEIQSLRSRIAAKQLQLSNSRILNLGRSKS